MIPKWFNSIRPQGLRNFIIQKWGNLHLDRWEQENVLLDLRPLVPSMRSVIISGGYETSEIELCRQFVTNEDKVLEIGSAIGYVSLFCLKNLGVGQICCVEPNSKTAASLINNYSLNGYFPSLIQGCFTGNDGEFELQTSPDFWCDRIGTSSPASGLSEKVNGYSFKSILAKVPFSPTVIIMDVEGAELNLQPAEIPDYVKYLILEIHPGACGWEASFGHLASLINEGFAVCGAKEDVYVLRNTRQSAATFEIKN